MGLNLDYFLEIVPENLDRRRPILLRTARDEELSLERGHDLVVDGAFFVSGGFLSLESRCVSRATLNRLDLSDCFVGRCSIHDRVNRVTSIRAVDGNAVERLVLELVFPDWLHNPGQRVLAILNLRVLVELPQVDTAVPAAGDKLSVVFEPADGLDEVGVALEEEVIRGLASVELVNVDVLSILAGEVLTPV